MICSYWMMTDDDNNPIYRYIYKDIIWPVEFCWVNICMDKYIYISGRSYPIFHSSTHHLHLDLISPRPFIHPPWHLRSSLSVSSPASHPHPNLLHTHSPPTPLCQYHLLVFPPNQSSLIVASAPRSGSSCSSSSSPSSFPTQLNPTILPSSRRKNK